MNNSVVNERLKLLANFATTAAAAFLSAGVIGPGVTFFYGLIPSGTALAPILSGSGVCLLVCAGIHLVGRAVLGGIRE
jgi:hypothetical protein